MRREMTPAKETLLIYGKRACLLPARPYRVTVADTSCCQTCHTAEGTPAQEVAQTRQSQALIYVKRAIGVYDELHAASSSHNAAPGSSCWLMRVAHCKESHLRMRQAHVA